MEKVLDRNVNRGCVLERTNLGLYNLKVNDESGRIIVNVSNVSFMRAVSILEENMYLSGRTEQEGKADGGQSASDLATL